jgi:hypothetical protein
MIYVMPLDLRFEGMVFHLFLILSILQLGLFRMFCETSSSIQIECGKGSVSEKVAEGA